MGPRRSTRVRIPGFTLIEILISIAIIALLIAISLPALRAARDAGRAVVCLSNQSQIGRALAAYAATYSEWTPRECGSSEFPAGRPQIPATRGSTFNLTWAFNLRPFLDPFAHTLTERGGIGDLFARAPYYRDPARPPDPHRIHYVVNGLRFAAPGVLATHPAVAPAKPPTRLSRYPRPADVIYLSCLADDPGGRRWSTWYAGDHEVGISLYYDLWRASNVNGVGGSDATSWQRTAPRRHGNGANAVFLDGHAAFIRGSTLTDIATWDDGDYSPMWRG